MQDVRLIEGYARIFQLTLLAPKSLAGRLLTWPASEKGFQIVHTSGGRGAFVASGAVWLVRNRSRYDAVIAQEELTAALAANLSRLLTKRPVILQLGRTTEEYFRCRRARGKPGIAYWPGLLMVKALAAFNQRQASAIGASSRYIVQAVRRRAHRAVAIPAYGVDTDLFSPGVSKREARQRLDLSDSQIAMWRSRVAPEKDPETFIRAVRNLRQAGRDVTALYVGGEYEAFKRVSEGIGLEVTLRDAVHPRELALYYAASDVVVQTSLAEGLGLSPLEALACEVPVVVSAVGGLTEAVLDRETGLQIPKGDAEATAKAIAWVLDHPAEAAELGRRGRKLIMERYSASTAFDAWESLVEEVVAAG